MRSPLSSQRLTFISTRCKEDGEFDFHWAVCYQIDVTMDAASWVSGNAIGRTKDRRYSKEERERPMMLLEEEGAQSHTSLHKASSHNCVRFWTLQRRLNNEHASV